MQKKEKKKKKRGGDVGEVTPRDNLWRLHASQVSSEVMSGEANLER